MYKKSPPIDRTPNDTMGNPELVLTPNDDMRIQARTSTARVPSATLFKSSSVFRKMLGPPWAEGMALLRGEDLLLDLEDDDSEALKFVLQAEMACGHGIVPPRTITPSPPSFHPAAKNIELVLPTR